MSGRLPALAAALLCALLLAPLSCSREEPELLPTPETARFWGRAPLRFERLPAERCAEPPLPRRSVPDSCGALTFHVGFGDTARVLWADYPDELSAWRAQLDFADTLSFSAGKSRIALRLPADMVFPDEPFRDLRALWPERLVDGGFLFERFPVQGADFGSEGLQEGKLLGVPVDASFACRSYRSGEYVLCWSAGTVSPAEFAKWAGSLPLEGRGEGLWGMAKGGQGVRVALFEGHLGLISGNLAKKTLDSLAEKLLSLQAWSL